MLFAMLNDGLTRPVQREPGKLTALRVDAVAGPDTGSRCDLGSDVVTVGKAAGNDLVLTDPTVSRFHLELSRVPGGVLVVDLGTTNGTLLGSVRLERGVVQPGSILDVGETSLRVTDSGQHEVELAGSESLAGLRGSSSIMRRLMAQIRKVATTDASVLLHGESGTGKEVTAQAIHELSSRAEGPFITVDCAALTPTLVASELFGHERGAFTGAERRNIGAFERAAGGTLFLDEIGELPPALQANLLGVLERRKFRRLGGSEEISISVRVISATNRDLRAEVNRGSFRNDLYYRLAVATLKLPALREHPEDIPLLVEHFLRQCGHAGPISEVLADPVMEQMKAYSWPGNARELRNLLEATLAFGEPPELSHDDGFDPLGHNPFEGAWSPLLERTYKDARSSVLSVFEQSYLPRLLERAGGNVSKAARIGAMDRTYLIELLRRHGLK